MIALTLTHFFIAAAFGLAVHMILRFTSEDGNIIMDTTAKGVVRYVLLSICLTAGALIPMIPADVVTPVILESAWFVGLGGGSLSSAVLRYRDKKAAEVRKA